MDAYTNKYGEMELPPNTSQPILRCKSCQKVRRKYAACRFLDRCGKRGSLGSTTWSPSEGHLITLLRSAKRRGDSVPWVPEPQQADGEGFEPPGALRRQQFSRLPS